MPPDGGATVFLVGDTYTTLLAGEQTGGAFTLLEALVPANTGPPPHQHEAAAGTVIFVPRGTPHPFSNTGAGNARMIFMYSPAGMEGMFAEIGSPGTRGTQGPPLTEQDVAAMIAVAGKYRFTIVAPE